LFGAQARSLADLLADAGLADHLGAFEEYGVESVADALDPLLVNAKALQEDIGLTAAQTDAFFASLEAAKK